MRRRIQCALQSPQGQLGTTRSMAVEHARCRLPANRLVRVNVAGSTVSVGAAARMERRGERVFEGFEATGDNCHGWPMKRGNQPIAKAQKTFKKALNTMNSLFSQVDSGNKEEAENAANQRRQK